jgi:hypothetical protein
LAYHEETGYYAAREVAYLTRMDDENPAMESLLLKHQTTFDLGVLKEHEGATRNASGYA